MREVSSIALKTLYETMKAVNYPVDQVISQLNLDIDKIENPFYRYDWNSYNSLLDECENSLITDEFDGDISLTSKSHLNSIDDHGTTFTLKFKKV